MRVVIHSDRMRRGSLPLLCLVLLLLAVIGPAVNAQDAGRGHALAFSAAPSAGSVISGSQTIAISNTTSLSWVQIDLVNVSSGQSSGVVNLTASPWIHAWDSTGVNDGEYRLRASAMHTDGTTSTQTVQSGNFSVDNTPPSALTFSVSQATIGTGASITDRAWFTIPETGSLSFSWGATDTHLLYATLSGVPGPGSPPNDGPGFLLQGWDWSSGAFPEGTWSAQLTVYDAGGLSTKRSLYIGIDRSGPTVARPTLSITSDWTNTPQVTFTGLSSGASDGGGSGIDHYEARDGTSATWTDMGSSGGGVLALAEGVRLIQFRGVDKVGNAGPEVNVTLRIDRSPPTAGGWTVPELTTTLFGVVSISVASSDTFSGVDAANSSIEYGFDVDGTGNTPDITSTWLSVGSGTSGQLPANIAWSIRQGQYLALRANIQDHAGNVRTTTPSFLLVLPGLDLFWKEASHVDRLVVLAGSGDSINITSILGSNMGFSGSVTVRLEMAAADRDLSSNWTSLETRALAAGSLNDMTESLDWSVSINSPGEWDLRLVIDPDASIPEKDEGNNEDYLVVSGAEQRGVAAVTSFSPTVIGLLLAGIVIGWVLYRSQAKRDEEEE